VAYGGKLLHAWREQDKTTLQSVSAPVPTEWTTVATGDAVHELLVSLGIFDMLVARLGDHLENVVSSRARRRWLARTLFAGRPAPWQR
jgi:hypothetical protein